MMGLSPLIYRSSANTVSEAEGALTTRERGAHEGLELLEGLDSLDHDCRVCEEEGGGVVEACGRWWMEESSLRFARRRGREWRAPRTGRKIC